MLWIAIHLPQLVPPASPSPSEAAAHTAALHGLADWAGRFTSAVSLQGSCGLLLEVAGSLTLFGGLKKMVAEARLDLAAMRYTAQLAGAPTPRAAWWLAVSNRQRFFDDPKKLRTALSPLPIEVLDCTDYKLLQSLGLKQVGDLLALPRDGLARRLGQPLVDALDQALGHFPEARRFYTPPPCFDGSLELPAEVGDTEALGFAAKRLMIQLGGFLAARNGAVRGFELQLAHRDSTTPLNIGLVAPSRDVTHLLHLLRERLSRLRLPAPVRSLRLQAPEVLSYAGENATLFHDEISAGNEWPKLVEQLRARLGTQNVQGLQLKADHRPEAASVAADVNEAGANARFALRPLWLLSAPERLQGDAVPRYEGTLKLLAGPERIRSGWWDGAPASRDYFVAQNEVGALLWVYRETGRAWYLQGWFA